MNTGIWPLYEVEDGVLKLTGSTQQIADKKHSRGSRYAITCSSQGRFAHFTDDDIDYFQSKVDEMWDKWLIPGVIPFRTERSRPTTRPRKIALAVFVKVVDTARPGLDIRRGRQFCLSSSSLSRSHLGGVPMADYAAPCAIHPSRIPNRWVQLIAGVIAMMAIANLQYAWTLFTKPIQKLTCTSPWRRSRGYSLHSSWCETWLVPFEGLPDRPHRSALHAGHGRHPGRPGLDRFGLC